jgi:very-short-patch-repair endonuclease
MRRTKWLEDQGFRVIRFWNNEILENKDGVLLAIGEALSGDGPPSP